MRKAYTLIEIIIVIGVLAILIGLASLSLVSFGRSADIKTAKTMVISGLKEARTNAMANLDDKDWGVHLEESKLVIFSHAGDGYNPTDQTNSTRLLEEGNLSWQLNGGGSEIYFFKKTGQTNNHGTITITGSGGENLVVNINSQGMIE